MPTDTERIDELEAQIALLKGTLQQFFQLLLRTGIELERNYDYEITGAEIDWDKDDLVELKKPFD